MLGSMTSSASGGSSSGGAMKLSSAVVGSLLSEKVDQVTQLQAQFDVKKSEAENSPAQQHAKQVSGNLVHVSNLFLYVRNTS